MPKYTFSVKGSQPDPYLTNFSFDGVNVTASCNCQAGQLGQYCKHRLDILKGDSSCIVSNNLDELGDLMRDFIGSPLDVKLVEIHEKEEELAKAKKHIDGLKKQVARIMAGN